MTEPNTHGERATEPEPPAPPRPDVSADAGLDGELREARSHLDVDVEALADEVQRELGVDLRAWVRPDLIERVTDLVSPIATAARIVLGAVVGGGLWIAYCAWMLHGSVTTFGLVIGIGLAAVALPFLAVAVASSWGIHVAAGHVAALTRAGRELAGQATADAAQMLALRDDPLPPARAARLLLRGTLLVVVLPGVEVGVRRALKLLGRPVAWAVRRVASMVIRRALPPTVEAPSQAVDAATEPRTAADAAPTAAAEGPAKPAADTTALPRLQQAMSTLGDRLETVGTRAPMAFRRWTWIGTGMLAGLAAMGIALVALVF